jgi:hypothetical protein
VAEQLASSEISVEPSVLGNELLSILMAPNIQPGSDPSYQLCKTIYLYHPLGQKMAESPINMAQSQARELTIQDAPEEVVQAFSKEWEKIGANGLIHNTMRLSRVYGISSLVVGCEEEKSDQPLQLEKIWSQALWFNVLDPLNTAGSLVLSQIPTAEDFTKPVVVRASGQVFHRSRYQVVMNENPIYLAYTTSAFGFVGRSVYQRALFPLKSFIRSMVADDMIATKLGLLIAKMKMPGSVLDKIMAKIAGLKRALLKQAQTGQVLSIDVEEEIETLNMQNVDGAGTFARGNILKNVATAADMPAKLLENETMVEGFGEGTEDAKTIARYIELIRMKMQPLYAFFDNLVQYRAWNPEFYKRMQNLHPTLYGDREYEDVFSEWRTNFAAEWPSLLIEPESEEVKVEQTKYEAIVAAAQTMLPELDPENKARLMQWVTDNLNENKMLFPHALELDLDELRDFQEEQQEKQEEQAEKQLEALAQGGAAAGGPPGKPGKPGAKPPGGGIKPPGNGAAAGGGKDASRVANKIGAFRA